MSATYRIDLTFDPHSSMYPWDATVTRLSDDKRMTIEIGVTGERALFRAREYVRNEEGTVDIAITRPQVVYVDDQGRDAEAPAPLGATADTCPICRDEIGGTGYLEAPQA